LYMMTGCKGVIEMAKPNVIVYSSTHCTYCNQVKQFLDSKGVVFEERNVDTNERFAGELYNMGMRSVPVTVIGSKKIVGMNPTAIGQALED
ncbi:glutaredoxin family protein, partial [Paenibacillus larvae]|uniref:glutaredoxin family protein n=1 Tax=Paenibacillus larvae TaxID=1464 RepID=UPI00399084B5